MKQSNPEGIYHPETTFHYIIQIILNVFALIDPKSFAVMIDALDILLEYKLISQRRADKE